MKYIPHNCNECQEPYEAEQRYLNRGQGMFCSRRCSSIYHGRNRVVKHEPNTMCAWCGIDFYRKPAHKNSKSGLYFCCVEHQNLGATNNTLYRVGPPATTNATKSRNHPREQFCCICQKTLSSYLRNGPFLHPSCRSILSKAHNINYWLSGDNSVTLTRTRTSGLPSGTKAFVKEFLIDTRGDRCEVCGWDEKAPDGRSIIQMDHINGNCFDNRPENLKLICPNHHAMTPNYGSLNKGSGRAHRRKSA